MKHILVLLLLFSFSAFAYENPYRDAKRWEAEKRQSGGFSEGQDAYYNQNRFDSWEWYERNRAEAEREMQDFRDSVERDRYR